MAGMKFFGDYGDVVQFTDYNELASKFSHINCSVPRRSEGRKTTDEERWCLWAYLMTLAHQSYIPFPIEVEKSERPDFVIKCPSGTFGLEVTNAGPQEWHKQQTRLERSMPGSVLEALPENELPNALRRPGEPLTGEGWIAPAAVAAWGGCITAAIGEKMTKLTDYLRDDARTCALLIYDNTHVAQLVADDLNSQCIPSLLRLGLSYEVGDLSPHERTLRSVSIIRGQSLLYDVLRSCIELQLVTIA